MSRNRVDLSRAHPAQLIDTSFDQDFDLGVGYELRIIASKTGHPESADTNPRAHEGRDVDREKAPLLDVLFNR